VIFFFLLNFFCSRYADRRIHTFQVRLFKNVAKIMLCLRCMTAAAILLLLSAFQVSGYKYETKYFTVPVS
jgi:hypothetical protein